MRNRQHDQEPNRIETDGGHRPAHRPPLRSPPRPPLRPCGDLRPARPPAASRPAGPGGRRLGRAAGLAAAALLLILGLGAGTARADACSGCVAPYESDLVGTDGFALEWRTSAYGVRHRDYLETDAGECSVSMDGTPQIRVKNQYLSLMSTGEAWKCPHSEQCSTITASVSESDSSDWTQSASGGGGFSLLGIQLSAQLTSTLRTHHGVSRSFSVSQQLCATPCRRLPWEAYLVVAEMEAQVAFSIHRRFSWWTKNRVTGDTVHRHGSIWMECGSGVADFEARAPLSLKVHVRQRGCDDVECQGVPTVDLGWFPEDEDEEKGDDEDADDPNDGADAPNDDGETTDDGKRDGATTEEAR